MKPKKLGIVLCTYNRPEYLSQCLESLSMASLPNGTHIVIVDDCSTDHDTIKMIKSFGYSINDNGIRADLITKEENSGICDSLAIGFKSLLKAECDYLINLDSDAIVRWDFAVRLMRAIDQHPDHIWTGFNCLTKNTNGTERHPILADHGDHFDKKSVGGINFAMTPDVFEKYVHNALKECREKGGNWDHKASIASMADGKPIKVLKPSVVQHIGFNSAMNHTEEPDTAQDFRHLDLPQITLMIVDCINEAGAIHAIRESIKDIQFFAVKFLTSLPIDEKKYLKEGIQVIKIRPIRSKEEYSNFMIRELGKYFDSSHCLIIQADGYVKNWKAWDPAWLNTDYIGATWWYNDGMNVGNGGFSLRSHRLHWILINDMNIKKTHPEDDVICRQYRPHLEKYGIRFGTEEQARRFSIEGYKQQEKHYDGQFGFHGKAVRFTPALASDMQKDTIIINQFFGIGDVIFCINIAREYIAKGHWVIWPVESQYVAIGKHYPDITFVDKSLLAINYESKEEVYGNGFRIIPLRWSHHICKVQFKDCMKSKYMMFDRDWSEWKKNAEFISDEKSENALMKHLGIRPGDKYILVNTKFRSNNTGDARIKIDPKGMKVVEMSSIEGFTLIDWSAVIQNATEIHTVSTSIIYLLELLAPLPAKIFIYIRKPDEVNHENYQYILRSNQYQLMP